MNLLALGAFKTRLYPMMCGTCRTGYNALTGCGSHIECRHCGVISRHMSSRSERRTWRRGHLCASNVTTDLRKG